MRLLRSYEEKDKPYLTEMLLAEGIPYLEMDFEAYPTMVLEDDKKVIGFFTLKKTHNFPMLQHFCVGREYRSFKTALFLVKCFRKIVKELGFKKVIIHAKKEYLLIMICWCFHTKSYTSTKDATWFLVKI